MADQEITSFIGKFKYLSAAGFKATLEFKSDQHGSVSISLTSEVGSVTPLSNQPPPPPSFHRRGRYFRGPSYGRRQLRRRATQESNSREQTIFLSQPMILIMLMIVTLIVRSFSILKLKSLPQFLP